MQLLCHQMQFSFLLFFCLLVEVCTWTLSGAALTTASQVITWAMITIGASQVLLFVDLELPHQGDSGLLSALRHVKPCDLVRECESVRSEGRLPRGIHTHPPANQPETTFDLGWLAIKSMIIVVYLLWRKESALQARSLSFILFFSACIVARTIFHVQMGGKWEKSGWDLDLGGLNLLVNRSQHKCLAVLEGVGKERGRVGGGEQPASMINDASLYSLIR